MDKKIYKEGVLIYGSIVFMLFVFAPLELYFNNQSEFWFDLSILFPTMLITACIMFLIGGVLLYVFGKKTPKLAYGLQVCLQDT